MGCHKSCCAAANQRLRSFDNCISKRKASRSCSTCIQALQPNKLATNALSCSVSFDDAGGKVPIIKREEGAEDEVPLSPQLGPHDLNLIVDKLKHVKVALPA